MTRRAVARELAANALKESRPLEWFEELYARHREEEVAIPWADLTPNPNAIELFERKQIEGAHKTALKVGSGLGDDAEYLAQIGFQVIAFDISPTAIELTKSRFPRSDVTYVVADLFDSPSVWTGRFDLVWESYTLQVLPPDLRSKAVSMITRFMAENGQLVLVSRARDPEDPEGTMPWPLTRAELREFEYAGLECVLFEDYVDTESPPVRRFRAIYRKPAQQDEDPMPDRRAFVREGRPYSTLAGGNGFS